MKIIILGAGVGGLTAAHQLSKLGYDIHIYERNNISGGLARSLFKENLDHIKGTGKYYSDYCWKVIGAGYTNLVPILKEIPYIDTESELVMNETKTVYDNLKPIQQYFYGRDDGNFLIEKGNSFISSGNLYKIVNGIRKTRKYLD